MFNNVLFKKFKSRTFKYKVFETSLSIMENNFKFTRSTIITNFMAKQ